MFWPFDYLHYTGYIKIFLPHEEFSLASGSEKFFMRQGKYTFVCAKLSATEFIQKQPSLQRLLQLFGGKVAVTFAFDPYR
jgi:hypothetical protein